MGQAAPRNAVRSSLFPTGEANLTAFFVSGHRLPEHHSMPQQPHIALAASILSDGGLTLPDGTIWSHAATLGTFEKGGTFRIDDQTIRSFVANFRSGSPSKVPVDYDHGSTSGIADGSHRVAKAGDVAELRAVLSDADVTPEIRAQITAYEARRTDLRLENAAPSYYGLWARWIPTTKALSMVKEREYTDMSIAFSLDYTNNVGADQGPTILAIALTNTPFLDNMIPVAASRGNGGTGAESPKEKHEMPNKIALALSAFLGKPVETDDEMVTELNTLRTREQTRTTEQNQLTEFRSVVAAEFDNEIDTAKVLTKVKQLKAEVAQLKQKAETGSKAAVGAKVELIMGKHEKKLTVPAKAMFTRQLTAELEAQAATGTDEKTETEKVMDGMPEIKQIAGTQQASADNGTNTDATDAFEQKRAELYRTDPDIVELAKKNVNSAYALSLRKARAALSTVK